MQTLILVLAIAGVAAVLAHAARMLLRLVHGGVNAFFAGELAGNRARRGDVTGLQEALKERGSARTRRQLALVALAFLAAMLAVPPLTPWPRLLYAAYALLWLVPQRRRAEG